MALITMDDIEKLSPVFKGERGKKRAEMALRITGIDQLAERYGRHEDLSGALLPRQAVVPHRAEARGRPSS